MWSKSKESEAIKKDAPGVYLDDIKDDQEMLSIYVGSSVRDRNSSARDLQSLSANDDDTESGNGPSLPMSPHSVEGAVGGPSLAPRMRYDSEDESSRRFPDVAISLCGGLEASNKETLQHEGVAVEEQVFSTTLFEQSIISYDDFEMHLRNSNSDLFSNPNLVVRVGHQYLQWQEAAPIIMSAVLYGRLLPADILQGAKATNVSSSPSSKDMPPNSRSSARSSSWWPFGSRKGGENMEPGAQEEQKEDPNVLEDMEKDAKKEEEPAAVKTEVEAVKKMDEKELSSKEEVLTKDDKKEQESNSNSNSEEESDPDIRRLNEGIRARKYKKTLRLSSKNIVSILVCMYNIERIHYTK